MEQLNGFTWEGSNGERLKFADLPQHEQRVALIAAGALLRGGRERREPDAEAAEQLSAAS